ncbi:unnamed protein product [Lactuca saligna]|uniref:TIR domain-containing protein n=1 Tax=Lactuca saligna TaxID=75948 RepID=A0AA36E1X2_LACSI|nr:unnamed protein product [Lactuca saligna]
MALSSTSSNQKSFKYDVFLSFRGVDTRRTFVDRLYGSLKQLSIPTFRDNEEFEKGKQIDELFKAIEESKLFIIVFSKNYASSSWCLKELEKIMECQRKIEHIAYPIYYDVDLSEIRKQIGEVGGAFSKHSNEEVGKWEEAVEEAGHLVGWDMRNREEAEVINEIVEQILLKLRPIYLSNDENLIGMEPRMLDLESSLGLGWNNDVRMIGIVGMGGIGKTTLARAIFDKVSFHFEGKSFVENIREVSRVSGMRWLQKQVLLDIFKDEDMDVSSVHDGKHMMKMRLPGKKVLVVLDDVDNADQLEALAGATNWFKGGSRIIITTRDKQVLTAHRVNMIHNVSFLSDEEAICLFSRHAFGRSIPIQGYEGLSKKVVNYAAGLPLTIKVLGSFLRGKEEFLWMDALTRLETIPSQETLKKLELSYISLEDDHKEIFLDVACFMKGLQKEDAIRILESCGLHAIYGLTVLEQKSLISISNQRLSMHDRIEELGRNIVRRSHPREPNKHSRLWIREEIEDMLSRNAGTDATTCIRLEQVELSPEIVMKGLGNLQKLRVLLLSEIDDDYFGTHRKFDQVKQYFPNALQFLSWEGYPVLSLPQAFKANNLVGLELPSSRITKLWESGERKVLKKLRFLDLSFSKLRTLNLDMTPNLERLNLNRCYDLRELQAPAGSLEKLVYLNLIGCSRFRSFSFIKQLEPLELQLLSLPKLDVIVESLGKFPRYSRDNLPKLQFTCFYLEKHPPSTENGQKSVSLNLQPCTKLESVSGSICGLKHLRELTFHGCIPEVPNDLDQLQCLEKLSLLSTHITRLPDSICMLKHLRSFKLESCRLLEELPKDLGQLECLEKLSLLSTGIRRLPDSIYMLRRLRSLKVRSCLLLEEVPDDIGQIACLEKLNLLSARIRCLPDSICMLKHLKSLELESCVLLEKLPEDLGKLECLEKLILTKCISLEHIPNSIYIYLQTLNNTGTESRSRFAENCCKKSSDDLEAVNTLKALHLSSISSACLGNLLFHMLDACSSKSLFNIKARLYVRRYWLNRRKQYKSSQEPRRYSCKKT